jgi:uracil-DNA glycosylase
MEQETLEQAMAVARECSVCAAHLPLGPRPVFRASRTARLLIVGQAPGTKVHETGIPWNDRSGDRLRDWLGLDHESFYDESRVAILPAGFCYPGRYERGGDLPPRPECAPMWHRRLTVHMPNIELTLLTGQYAQACYLGRRHPSLTATVAAWRDYLPEYLPLPHPSWRNTAWLRKNPWFEAELLPVLRNNIGKIVAP